MSLIQEALKRKLEEQTGATPAPAPAPDPVEPAKSAIPKAVLAIVILLALIAVAVALFLFAGKSWFRKPEAAVIAAPAKTHAAPAAPGAETNPVASIHGKVDAMKTAVTEARQDLGADLAAPAAALKPTDVAGVAPAAPPPAVQPVADQAAATNLAAASPGKAGKPWPKILINGIMARGEHGAAIVNNQIISAGEFVGGARVVEVRERGILFDFDGETRFLGLGQSE